MPEELINAVTELDTVEISIVPQGANRKKWAFFKSEERAMPAMDDQAMEFIEKLLGVKSEGEKNLAKIFKAEDGEDEMDEKTKTVMTAVLRALDGVKDKLPGDVMAKLAKAGGYPGPSEKAEHEDDDDKDKEKETPFDKAEHEGETDEEKKKREEAALAKQEDDEKDKEEEKKAMAKNAEPILKADGSPNLPAIPADIRPVVEALWKSNVETKKELAVERDLRIEKEMISKAETDYANIGNAQSLGVLLKDMHGASPKLAKRFESILKAANEQLAQSKIFDALGSGRTPDDGSAEQKLDGMAKSYMAKADVTYPEAYSKVMATPEGQELYNSYNTEKLQ